MNKKDIRIGDYISYNNKYFKVDGVVRDFVNIKRGVNEELVHVSKIDCITINDSILNKIGFKRDGIGSFRMYNYFSELGHIVINWFEFNPCTVVLEDNSHYTIASVKVDHLHELQHLAWDFLRIELNKGKEYCNK